MSPESEQGCPRCGGPLVAGRLGTAILGGPRFTVRLGTTEVGTEVSALMCEDCGHVELTAKDPQTVCRALRARQASRRVGGTPRSLRWRI